MGIRIEYIVGNLREDIVERIIGDMIRNVEGNVSGIREGNWQRNMAGNTVLPEIVAPLAGLVLHCLLMTPTGDHKATTVAAAAAVATTVPLPLPQWHLSPCDIR